MSNVNKRVAMESRIGDVYYHRNMRNADGSPLRARVNGKCKVWKRDGRWRLPMKYGLRECFYISDWGGDEWYEREWEWLLEGSGLGIEAIGDSNGSCLADWLDDRGREGEAAELRKGLGIRVRGRGRKEVV